ncbi:MAG: hypothetical protein ABIF71_04435 [Planctomycetota bacterium]
MAGNSVNLSSPEVIRQFRGRFIDFSIECRKELESVRTDMQAVVGWLTGEQKAHWESELRKRSEEAAIAKRTYVFMLYDTSQLKKDHLEDERQAMIKTARRRDEAEAKLKVIKQWLLTLNHEVMNDLKPCEVLSSYLATLTPRAVHRLDQMLDNIDAYLRPAPAGTAGGSDTPSTDAGAKP